MTSSDLFPCPKCAHPSFRCRGYVMACDDCGWDSETGCGADGFDVPCGLDCEDFADDDWDEEDDDELGDVDAYEPDDEVEEFGDDPFVEDALLDTQPEEQPNP